MRRIIETDENGNIRIAGNSHTEIWMTAWEMAELFNATVPSIQKEIKAVRRSGIFTDYEACKYIRMENGYSADIFNLDIIIAVAYSVNTFYAHAFRKWLKEKAVSENKKEQKSVFILLDTLNTLVFSLLFYTQDEIILFLSCQ